MYDIVVSWKASPEVVRQFGIFWTFVRFDRDVYRKHNPGRMIDVLC
jgi:hypothetical protein